MKVIRSNENAEKYHGVTGHFKIWSDCERCGGRFSEEFFGTLPSSHLKRLCQFCDEEILND